MRLVEFLDFLQTKFKCSWLWLQTPILALQHSNSATCVPQLQNSHIQLASTLVTTGNISYKASLTHSCRVTKPRLSAWSSLAAKNGGTNDAFVHHQTHLHKT